MREIEGTMHVWPLVNGERVGEVEAVFETESGKLAKSLELSKVRVNENDQWVEVFYWR